MAQDFNDAMVKDLKTAKEARDKASTPENRQIEAISQIADALIQIRWELADVRSTIRAMATKRG